MKKHQTKLLRIGKITGVYYFIPNRKTERIAIYGIGAPLPPDNGALSDASIILSYGVDVFVPDYIGYGRSEGIFTPMNCVKTFLDLFDKLSEGCTAFCNSTGERKYMRYSEIHCIGRSFGGAYVTLLPRFNKKIKKICAIFPVLNWSNVGKSKGHPEETVGGFFRAMKLDGYQHLYRGILSPIWKKHFSGQDNLNPIDNISYLKQTRLFMGHGEKDTSIYYDNSLKYYEKLTSLFPHQKGQFNLKLYPGGHNNKTSNKTIHDYLGFMGLSKST